MTILLINSARALIDKQKKEDAERLVQLAKEQKKDAYDADIKSLATEALKVAKQNQRTTKKLSGLLLFLV